MYSRRRRILNQYNGLMLGPPMSYYRTPPQHIPTPTTLPPGWLADIIKACEAVGEKVLEDGGAGLWTRAKSLVGE